MKLQAALVGILTLLSIYHSQFAGEFAQTTDIALELTQDSNLELYKAWRAQYKPSNSENDVDYYRYYIWLENLKFVQSHRDAKFTVAMNKFADLTNEEFVSMYLGHISKTGSKAKTTYPVHNGPVNVNWTAENKVGTVQNQGQCGSCWSFSAAESLTSLTAIKNNTWVYYSEQELVDCSAAQGNMGCNGGVVQWAYDYVLKNGIESATDYPYKGFQSKCKKNSNFTQYTPLTSYVEINEGDCNGLATAIQQQPVSIAIDASGLSFQLYSTGIFHNCKDNLNHAILLTGYNSDPSTGYWIAENSWGAGWGQKGYIQFALGNTCGICNQATYPVWN